MKTDRVPVAREGVPFVLSGVFVSVIFALLGWSVPSVIAVLLTLFCLYFFRDPERTFSTEHGAVVSPADGSVLSVRRGVEHQYYQGDCVRISIFMSLWDVHVNRFPVTGTVRSLHYRPGAFLAANLEKASTGNEQNAVVLETDDGRKLVVVQVAGLIARRIVCWASVGDRALQASRMGMIRFGSRVDLYVPRDFEPAVSSGSRVRAGETLLGRLP